MERVSIIMGVYNAEATIQRALDSIIKQSYQEWIFIICNDGSTDQTRIILKEYQKKYEKKFLIIENKENLGLTYSLNRCLECVKTEYIARMDSDDVSLPNRLERQVHFLDLNKEYGFVGCIAKKFDENGIWGVIRVPQSPANKDLLWNSSFVHPTIMIRKNAMDLVNGYRNIKTTQRCEDYDLWLRLYANNIKGFNIQDVLFYYYEGQDSYNKRKYKYRVNEAITRFQGYKNLNLYPIGILFVFKPLFLGLLPRDFKKYIYKKRM